MTELVMAIWTLLAAILNRALCVALIGGAVQVGRVTCPPWWRADRLRVDGRFTCVHRSAEDWDIAPAWSTPLERDAKICCTGGSHPIVVDDRTVGCQR